MYELVMETTHGSAKYDPLQYHLHVLYSDHMHTKKESMWYSTTVPWVTVVQGMTIKQRIGMNISRRYCKDQAEKASVRKLMRCTRDTLYIVSLIAHTTDQKIIASVPINI